jgi:DtxR family Mn-dependent transcriptional regulator
LSASLGVARPSVTGALKSLAKKGLVNYQPYGCVTLTQSGLAMASKVAKKHDVIKTFLTDILGVDGPVAQKAACKAEHLLGPSIISRLNDFTNFAKKQARHGENLAGVMQKFTKSKRTER